MLNIIIHLQIRVAQVGDYLNCCFCCFIFFFNQGKTQTLCFEPKGELIRGDGSEFDQLF